ncbi:AAEL013507-PA [Aedes aegypti]|uniref:Odorant receptor n=2 Tax=Aedes aegypti TaxID=7159 RepID=Q16IY4_AEDAE|nr:odorant receptor 52 [Aedes aegypti]EAT34229.1 AAEL013507-PA [Aedes aegypti]DAA80393.1 TPA_exp: odorant receptor 52 [Aedes aegypti]
MERIRKLVAQLQISVRDDESDYFRTMDYFLILGGIQLLSKNPVHQVLFLCYRMLMTVQFSVWFDRVYVAYSEWNSTSELIGVISFLLGLVMIVVRAIIIRLYLEDIYAARKYLGAQLNGLRMSESRIQSYRLLRRIGLVLEYTFFADQILFYAFGIYQDKQYTVPDNLSRLGWQMKLLFNIIISTNHFVFSSVYATILTVQNTLLMGIGAELDVILAQCDGIMARVDEKLKNAVDRDGDQRMLYDVRGSRAEYFFWKLMKRELNVTVARHSRLLEQIDILGGFFKMNFLVMFYMAIVIIGCASFYVNMLGLTVNTVIILSYVGAILLESYWFCKIADNMNDTNSQIGESLYNLGWSERMPEMPEARKEYFEIRETLLIVMTKVQQDLGISCGGMFGLSMQAFHELLKMIYSFLTFLLNTTS